MDGRRLTKVDFSDWHVEPSLTHPGGQSPPPWSRLVASGPQLVVFAAQMIRSAQPDGDLLSSTTLPAPVHRCAVADVKSSIANRPAGPCRATGRTARLLAQPVVAAEPKHRNVALEVHRTRAIQAIRSRKGRCVCVGRYLELQNERPFYNIKSSFFRHNSPFFPHFQKTNRGAKMANIL